MATEDIKYEVGQWVRPLKGGLPILIARIPDRSTTIYDDKDILDDGNGTKYYSNNVELWVPRDGELCYFYDSDHKEVPTYLPTVKLSRFQRMHEDTPSQREKGIYRDQHGQRFKYCEPFVYGMPTVMIKERIL